MRKFLMKNVNNVPCACCGEVFSHLTKDHVFIEFREDEIYNHYENRYYPVTELDGMSAVVTVPFRDEMVQIKTPGSGSWARGAFGLRLDDSTKNSVSV